MATGSLQTDDVPRDPTDVSLWRNFFGVLRRIDADISRIYSERQVTGVTPRQVKPLLRLAHRGPMTIGELAAALDVTHSAASQTVSALTAAGYVRSKPGKDARTRTIALTAKGRALVPLFEAEWRATEAAIGELESEMPYKVSQIGVDLEAALSHEGFYHRVSRFLEDGV